MNAKEIKKIQSTVKMLRDQADRLEKLFECKEPPIVSLEDWKQRWVAGVESVARAWKKPQTAR